MRIRAYMQCHDICCHQFEPFKGMYALFTADMYCMSNEPSQHAVGDDFIYTI
jgi:hypothetical protein